MDKIGALAAQSLSFGDRNNSPGNGKGPGIDRDREF